MRRSCSRGKKTARSRFSRTRASPGRTIHRNSRSILRSSRHPSQPGRSRPHRPLRSEFRRRAGGRPPAPLRSGSLPQHPPAPPLALHRRSPLLPLPPAFTRSLRWRSLKSTKRMSSSPRERRSQGSTAVSPWRLSSPSRCAQGAEPAASALPSVWRFRRSASKTPEDEPSRDGSPLSGLLQETTAARSSAGSSRALELPCMRSWPPGGSCRAQPRLPDPPGREAFSWPAPSPGSRRRRIPHDRAGRDSFPATAPGDRETSIPVHPRRKRETLHPPRATLERAISSSVHAFSRPARGPLAPVRRNRSREAHRLTFARGKNPCEDAFPPAFTRFPFRCGDDQ